jgi:hypothetical protein
MPHPLPRVGHSQPCIIGTDNDAIIGTLSDEQQRRGQHLRQVVFSRLPCVAIRVTYIDGHTADYDDRTHWYVEHGVLKLGSLKGRWDTYISPSSWETIDTNPL